MTATKNRDVATSTLVSSTILFAVKTADTKQKQRASHLVATVRNTVKFWITDKQTGDS